MKPNSLFKIPIPKSKWSRQLVMALVGVGLLAGIANSSSAPSIAANFIGRNGGPGAVLSPTDVAGVVPQPWWRNIDSGSTFTGFEGALWDNSGTFTAVGLDYAATDSWVSDGPTITPDYKMMKGILKARVGAPATLTVNNLPPTGVYEVYVYTMMDGTGAQGSVAIGTVTNYIAVQNSFNGTFVPATSVVPGVYTDANYIKFSNVQVDALGQVLVTVTKEGTVNNGVGIAGIQVVQLSGPAFPPNTDQCSILTQPSPDTVVAGGSAKFTVASLGPAKYQWKKNGVDVPGAITASVEIPTAVGEANSQITVVVYNNVNSVTSTPVTLTVLPANSGIGGSFIGRNTNARMLPDDSAGVIRQKNWFNIPSDPFSGVSELMAADGNTTMVKLVYQCSDSWSSDGPEATPDEKLMKGIIKCNPNPDTAPTGNSEKMFFTITNLPTGTYKVIVYCIENGADTAHRALMDVNIGNTTYYIEEENSFNGTFTRSSSTSFGDYLRANYVQFDSVTPTAGGTIAISAIKMIEDPQVSDGAGVAGIQLVQLTGSGFPTNSLPVVITADPQPGLAAAGAPITFSVGASGPFIKYQWKKNGVDIPGATGPSYTFNTALADSGSTYRVVVWNNVNTVASLDAALTVDAVTPKTLTQGFLTVDRYENIGGNTDIATGIRDLTNAIATSSPTVSFVVPGPNIPQTSPDIGNFGNKVSGWVKPDVTGNYTFFIRSDDGSVLFLNSVASASGTNSLPDPAKGDMAIAWENGCCNPFREPDYAGQTQTTLTPIFLEAGKYYGLVFMYKEGGGGDWGQVAWRIEGDTTPAASLPTIPAVNCYTMASPAGHRAVISQQPKAATVTEGTPVEFNVGVEVMPTTDAYAVQWLTNGVVVPGVTGTRYAVLSAPLAWNGLQVKARVITAVGQLETSTAALTVLADSFPPVPKAGVITSFAGSTQVGVGFDEAINTADLVPANFTFSGPAGSSGTFRVVTNSLDSYRSVVFDTTPMAPGSTGKVTVKNVRDLKGNAIAAAGVDATFTVANFGFADTGAPIRPGQVVPVGADGFDVLNGGRTEWATYDEATIAYQQRTGDFDVKVRVAYAEPASQWARCGIIARNALDAGEPSGDGRGGAPVNPFSAYAQTHVNPAQTLASSGIWAAYDPAVYAQPVNPTPNNGHEQNCRLTAGAATTGWGSTATAPTYPNAWLRLKRLGTTLNGYRSEDGVNWTSQGSVTLTDQQPTMYVGPFFAAETGNIWANGTPPGGFDVWGPFDATYDRLFVANFRDFGEVAGQASKITVGVIQDPVGKGDLVLLWTSAGVLQQSSTMAANSWTPVAGAPSGANGGRFEIKPTGGNMFYRVKVQ